MSIAAITGNLSAARDSAAASAMERGARIGGGTPTPDEVKRVASQFEAIILRQLLAPSIEPMMSGGLGGASGTGGGVYGYMLTDVLAGSIAQGGGLGLTPMLSRQLTSRGAALEAAPPDEAASRAP